MPGSRESLVRGGKDSALPTRQKTDRHDSDIIARRVAVEMGSLTRKVCVDARWVELLNCALSGTGSALT